VVSVFWLQAATSNVRANKDPVVKSLRIADTPEIVGFLAGTQPSVFCNEGAFPSIGVAPSARQVDHGI
jgi:hypothetical protein